MLRAVKDAGKRFISTLGMSSRKRIGRGRRRDGPMQLGVDVFVPFKILSAFDGDAAMFCYVICPVCHSRVEIPEDAVGPDRTDLFNVVGCYECSTVFDYDDEEVHQEDEPPRPAGAD
jgi:hypothetical protein